MKILQDLIVTAIAAESEISAITVTVTGITLRVNWSGVNQRLGQDWSGLLDDWDWDGTWNGDWNGTWNGVWFWNWDGNWSWLSDQVVNLGTVSRLGDWGIKGLGGLGDDGWGLDELGGNNWGVGTVWDGGNSGENGGEDLEQKRFKKS